MRKSHASLNSSSTFTPAYDADGNAVLIWTETGVWVISYNAQNRPVSFRNDATDTLVECAYDSQGRRFEKKVTVAGTVTLHERYVYDGYLQIAAFDVAEDSSPEGESTGGESAGSTLSSQLSLKRVIFWDPEEPTATRPLAVNVLGDNLYFPTVDLTKNVCELVDFYGDVAATYDYAPFGAVTAGTPAGTAVPANPFQWSSEVYDDELGLVYYNYRHYSPADGRWISRDPIEEQGGLNLYVFVGNNFSNGDYLGTISITGAGDYSWNVPTPITGLFVRVSLGVEGSWFTCCKGGKEVKMISLGGEISIEAVTGSAFKGKVRVKNSRGSKCRDRKTGRFVKCPEDGKGGGVAVGDFIGDSKECPKSTFYFQASIVGTFSVGVGLIGGSGGFDFPIYPKVSVPDLNIGYSYGTVGAEVTLGVKGEFRAVLWEGDSVSI